MLLGGWWRPGTKETVTLRAWQLSPTRMAEDSCLQVGELVPVVIPVHLVVVGCPVSSQRINCYTGGQLQKEPFIRSQPSLSLLPPGLLEYRAALGGGCGAIPEAWVGVMQP